MYLQFLLRFYLPYVINTLFLTGRAISTHHIRVASFVDINHVNGRHA